MIRFDFQTDI